MHRRILAIVSVLVILGCGGGLVWAQGDLDGVYLSEDGAFGFNYPSDWTLRTGRDGIVILWGETAEVGAYVYSPQTLAALEMDGLSTSALMAAMVHEWYGSGVSVSDIGSIYEMAVGERSAVRLSAQSLSRDSVILILALGTGEQAVIVTTHRSITGAREFASMLAGTVTYNPALAVMPTPEPTLVPREETTLPRYDAGWRVVMNALQDSRLVPEGGMLVFEQPFMRLNGALNLMQILGEDLEPRQNFVMSAGLTFNREATPDGESCVVSGRGVWEQDQLVAFLSAGIGEAVEGPLMVYSVDVVPGQEANFRLADPRFETITHTVTLIALDDQMTVFLDDELLWLDETVDARAGLWGIGLRGNNRTTECIAEDIWIYALPED